ncbi:Proline dehydrogenase 1, mitochondrial [Papilio machaon]|uniref:Proline dehydrogenase 1, mitochondrial n=1 Tax=Papilio machaon TaxID=76193 RepID=A0A0N1IDR0_PAPMA|nr:Proline dehydrogenase 1, mitochondrial [Papilio machaon]
MATPPGDTPPGVRPPHPPQGARAAASSAPRPHVIQLSAGRRTRWLRRSRVESSTVRGVLTMALLRRLASNAPRGLRALSSSPRTTDDLDLTFNSPRDAFKSKKTSELVRAYLVYQICSINWIVENNDMVSASGSMARSYIRRAPYC